MLTSYFIFLVILRRVNATMTYGMTSVRDFPVKTTVSVTKLSTAAHSNTVFHGLCLFVLMPTDSNSLLRE